MRIKNVSLVRKLEFQFRGNLHPNAIALGDVDHDQSSELVVGTLSGCLHIYKAVPDINSTSVSLGSSVPPWRTCSDLGTITAVVIGDIRNIGRNSIICVNAEGGCYMFDYPFISYLNDGSSNAATPLLTPTFSNLPNATAISLASNEDGAASPNPQPLGFAAQTSLIARANWSTLVPTNTSVALIGDIDGDGLNELVVGRTDRKIHAYQLSTHLAIPTSSSTRNNKAQTTRARAAFDYQKLVWINTSEWQVAQPIASLSLGSCGGSPLLVVGQDDGDYLCISSKGTVHSPILSRSPSSGLATPAFAIPSVTGEKSIVVSVHDGLVLDEVSNGRQRLSKFQVCPPSRVIGFGGVPTPDLDSSSPTGVVGWADGTTLLFNSMALACTRFQFPHAPVAAFVSGMFSLGAGDVPCLFYVGFKGSIYGYSDPYALSCQTTSQLSPFLSADLNPYTHVIENLSKLISSVPPSLMKKSKRKKKNNRPPTPPALKDDEKLALVYRYILYTALPLAARPHSLPHTTDAPPEVPLSELLGKMSLTTEDTTLVQPQPPKLPAPVISLARRSSTLHASLRSHPTQQSAASSPSTEPAVPVVTPSSASPSPSIYPSNTCVEDLERLKDYPLGFNSR